MKIKKINIGAIQLTLATFWIVDGLFQLQATMFTSKFAEQVIALAAKGEPSFVAEPMHVVISQLLLHPVIFNSLIALMQLLIGLLIIWKKSLRLGLVVSIIWGLSVWYLGEGLGGILGSQTSLLLGAPGAALLYAILSLSVKPAGIKGAWINKVYPAYWLIFAWLILWVGLSTYQIFVGPNTVNNYSAVILTNAHSAPGWIAPIDIDTAHLLSQLSGSGSALLVPDNMHQNQLSYFSNRGNWLVVFIFIIQIGIGIGVLFKRHIRLVALTAGIILSLCFWIIGQSLGGYYSGLATDLNSAPLFILMAIAIIINPNIDAELAKLGSKIETLLI